jgi:ABC-type uncharacterized transport system auxiliary subunit
MKSQCVILKWALILICCAGLWACKSSGPVVQATGAFDDTGKVLVLPFQNMAWLHGTNVNVRSPLTGKVFLTGPASEDANRLLTNLLVDALQRETAFQMVPSREAYAVMEALRSAGDFQHSPLKMLAQTGRMLNADMVIQGYLYRFKDRVGANYSAESAASVAFDVYLIDCMQQKLVWSGYFDQTQQALTDDLRYIGAFFQRGGRWVTAEEMATTAMDDMFKDFKQP